MGWMVRIREWWGRRRVLSRQVARQALTIARLQEERDGYEERIGSMQAMTKDLRRRLALSEAACAELREIVAGRPTDGELSRELARMLTTVDVLGCRIDGLATRLGASRRRPQDQACADGAKIAEGLAGPESRDAGGG